MFVFACSVACAELRGNPRHTDMAAIDLLARFPQPHREGLLPWGESPRRSCVPQLLQRPLTHVCTAGRPENRETSVGGEKCWNRTATAHRGAQQCRLHAAEAVAVKFIPDAVRVATVPALLLLLHMFPKRRS